MNTTDDDDQDDVSRTRPHPMTQTLLEFKEIIAHQDTKIVFAVPVPLHGCDPNDDHDVMRRSNPGEQESFMVGTILKFGDTSANIWFGWGDTNNGAFQKQGTTRFQ